jgi:hypothetical protein
MLRHASSNPAGTSIAIVIGAPLLWLMMLESAYLLSHWACGTGMKWPLHVVTLGTAVLLAGVLWMMPRRNIAGAESSLVSFLATMALWMTVGFILIAVASTIQPSIIQPCG